MILLAALGNGIQGPFSRRFSGYLALYAKNAEFRFGQSPLRAR